MKNLYVDMQNLTLEGDIIDISTAGNSTISKLVNISSINQNTEKDFYEWKMEGLSSIGLEYDNAIAFFSLNRLVTKKQMDNLLKDLKKSLKKDGKLLLWDIYFKKIQLIYNYTIVASLPENEKVELPLKMYYNPLRIKVNDILNLLEKNDFNVEKCILSNNIYYIEAVNKKEQKTDEYNFSST